MHYNHKRPKYPHFEADIYIYVGPITYTLHLSDNEVRINTIKPHLQKGLTDIHTTPNEPKLCDKQVLYICF